MAKRQRTDGKPVQGSTTESRISQSRSHKSSRQDCLEEELSEELHYGQIAVIFFWGGGRSSSASAYPGVSQSRKTFQPGPQRGIRSRACTPPRSGIASSGSPTENQGGISSATYIAPKGTGLGLAPGPSRNRLYANSSGRRKTPPGRSLLGTTITRIAMVPGLPYRATRSPPKPKEPPPLTNTAQTSPS